MWCAGSLLEAVGVLTDFLVQLAQKSVRSQKVAAVDRAREAFCAGYWFRIGRKCEVNLSSSYSPSLPPAHWVVRRGSEICNIARTVSRREANLFCCIARGGGHR